MSKLKVLTLVGTRPELIKLSMVIKALDKCAEHILVHTGQNYDYGLNGVFFEDMGIRSPNIVLNVAGENSIDTISQVLTESFRVFDEVSPDAILIYGDTNSCLSVISAKRLKIPVFHMEAGNRCFDERVPEELNRKIVDHMSDINMPLSEHARQYLINEGIRADRIIKIGSPMKEVINYHKARIDSSTVLKKLELTKNKYVIVSIHREENLDNDDNFYRFKKSLIAVRDNYSVPIIVSTHPRTRKKLSQDPEFMLEEGIKFLEPFSFTEYLNLQINSFFVISDSGTITEEASILGFRALTIRQSHERPEGMEQGTLIMSGLEPSAVLQSISILLKTTEDLELSPKIVFDYDVDNVSIKVTRAIMSYTHYINREVWKK